MDQSQTDQDHQIHMIDIKQNINQEENFEQKVQQQNILKIQIDPEQFLYQTGDIGALVYCLCQGYIKKDWKCKYGNTLLHWACEKNHLNLIKFLVEKMQIDINITNNQGFTIAMNSANFGKIQILDYAIKNGTNLKLRDNFNNSAFLYSFMGNSTLSVIYLLNQDVDINDKDNNGCGLIHWAAHFDNVNLLKLAISLGLDINAQDNEKKTPLIRAIENYSYNAIQYLLDQGVNVPNEYDINQCKSPDIKRALLKQQNWYHQILLTVQKQYYYL